MADDILEVKITDAAGGQASPSAGSGVAASDFSGAARVATRFAALFGPSGLASVVGRLESARHIFGEVARLSEQIASRQEKAARLDAKRIASLAKATEAAPEPSVGDRLSRLDDLRARRDNLTSRLGKATFGEDSGVDKVLGQFEKELKTSEDEISGLLKSLPKGLQERVGQADKLAGLESQSGDLKKQIDRLVGQIQSGAVKGNAAFKASGDIERLIAQQNTIDSEADALRSAGVRSRLSTAGFRGAAAARGAGAAAGGSGASAVAGSAAAAGPLVAVAGAAAVAVVGIGALAVATDRLIDRFDALSDRYRDYDPRIAAASAQRDIAREFGNFRRANLLGEDLARFIQLRSRSEQALEDIKARFDAVAIRILEPGLETIVGLLETIERVVSAVDFSKNSEVLSKALGLEFELALRTTFGPVVGQLVSDVIKWLREKGIAEDETLNDRFFNEFFGDGKGNRGAQANIPPGQVPNLPPMLPPPPFPDF